MEYIRIPVGGGYCEWVGLGFWDGGIAGGRFQSPNGPSADAFGDLWNL